MYSLTVRRIKFTYIKKRNIYFHKKIFKFKSSSLSSIYVYEFIKASNPKLVITFR